MLLQSARSSFYTRRYRPRLSANYSAASAISERTTARNSSISLSPFGVCRCQKVQPLQSFFFNATATTEIYTLSLHDALPILKMIGVSNLQSFIASMTQKLTLSDISDE